VDPLLHPPVVTVSQFTRCRGLDLLLQSCGSYLLEGGDLDSRLLLHPVVMRTCLDSMMHSADAEICCLYLTMSTHAFCKVARDEREPYL
jgi:hypothetical protein